MKPEHGNSKLQKQPNAHEKSSIGVIDLGRPFLANTSYNQTFKNFGSEYKVEKDPVFPVYSLPFNGSTDYQNTYNYEHIKNAPPEDPYQKTVVS